MSLTISAGRAAGNRADISSRMRSTPGPHGTRVPAVIHSGQSGGTGSKWPQ